MIQFISHTTLGAVLLSLFAVLDPSPAQAHTDSEEIEEMVVYGRAEQLVGAAHAASEGIVGHADLEVPPLLRAGELLEGMPGMVATQHSGTGKANQFFVRGFNLDHGTDLSVSAAGVPLNMRTHGHGQGYLDLNFIIPETVQTMTYRKGTYSARVGDFASAASAEFEFYDRMPGNVVQVTGGSYDYWRGLAAGSADVADVTLNLAVDVTGYQGPWDLPEDLQQTRLHVGAGFDIGSSRAQITLQGYDGEWDATDQIPSRAVEQGLIGPLGYIDPDLGGATERWALTFNLETERSDFVAYVVDYDFELFSNFTYLLNDPVTGDQFEQVDDRTLYGVRFDTVNGFAVWTRPAFFRWGGDIRIDDIDEVGLFATEARQRLSTVRQDDVRQSSGSAYGELEVAPLEPLRVVAGARLDYFDWRVSALRDENSGAGDDVLVSPKLAASYRFGESTEGYLNWGRGFHSNDVRGAEIAVDPGTGLPVDAVDVFAEAEGAEIGLRFEQGSTFNATIVAFQLDLDSELVFVGDAGTTEPNSATRRQGVELAGFWQTNDWLAMNAAYTYTDARYRQEQEGGGREIPGAIESTFTLTANGVWRNGVSASARLRWLSDAPLTEDGSVHSDSSLLVNASVGYRTGPLEFRLDAFNLLDSKDKDISYFYASRLPDEPPEGIEDVHYHPLEPRSVRASVRLTW